MHHEYIDKYSRLNTIIHKIDARIKILLSFILVVIISFSNDFNTIIMIIPFVLLALILSKVPLGFIIKRMIICLPFLLLLFFLPLSQAFLLISKSTSSIIIITLLVSTTKFTKIINALRFFKLPKLFIMMLSFFYRYIFLFIDTIHKMQHAREARCCKNASLVTASNTIGSIIVRSFEQSERVYSAMLARGYGSDYDDKD